MVTYIKGPAGYGEYLRRIAEEAKRDFQSLCVVRTFDPSKISDVDFLARHFPEWKLVGFETTTEGAIRETIGDGGSMVVMEDKRGERHAVILLRMRRDAHEQSWIDFINVAFLFHELGHVDDFEKGINFKVGHRDTEGSELYAHTFACRQLRERGFREVLGFYLGQLIDTALKLTSASARKAASDFKASPECKASELFAGKYVSHFQS